jgi:hypothetical protein
MKLLTTITLTALTLLTIQAHANQPMICLNNDLNNDGIFWETEAFVHFDRSMDPDKYAKLVHEIHDSGIDLDEANPQFEAYEDGGERAVQGYHPYYILSIHGDRMVLQGSYNQDHTQKHTTECRPVAAYFTGLPFPVVVDYLNLSVSDPHGSVHTAEHLTNHTVKLHGTPFWWLDGSLPRFRIDTSKN